MKKQYLYYPLFLGIFFGLGILIGNLLSVNGMDDTFTTAGNLKKRKLNRLIDIIDQRYVDEVNTDSIVDVTVNGILQNLDPHSVYISTDQAEAVADDMRGNFVGIGIRYFVNQDTIAVLSTVKDGPSEKAGIKSGDRILTVDGRPLYGDNKVSTDELKGKSGSRITLGVLKPGDSTVFNIPVTRGKIAIQSVDAAYMLNNKLGYIKVNRFAESTVKEFNQAIDLLKRKGAQQIAVDLRDNPGGVLQSALEMADEFLKDDQLMLFQKDRNNKRKNSYATDSGDFEDKPVFILINENSASASEVVAGALQDNDKGTIIGRRSFGKGLVQQEMQLGDGSAVRLTVARYYTPTGRSIQRPYNTGNEDYFNEYLERYENGELQDKSNIEVNDSLRYRTPGGKIVYGGGGIIPDVFVAGPKGYENQTLDYFARTGFADRMANEFLRTEGYYLRSMPKKEFIDSYQVPETLLLKFYQRARSGNNLSLRLTGNREFMMLLLKASLAEQLYGTELKIKLLNTQDPMIDKLLELSKSQKSS
ncbi:carboxyl-terminal processing protease [Nonlabens sp. Hel1_33_55]|uniref:S41 family peptidase n=1 Tax=Nonlabens sp. Hel1_33_55 TaxID=1336802 RepID=UPI000875AE94|nr:S41 family peptidase [Nonlabens sp. Hel1_33_55]SCY42499.1 carboxyl-terminal processing protease [Nonlabens sp. Hel1_33_55]